MRQQRTLCFPSAAVPVNLRLCRLYFPLLLSPLGSLWMESTVQDNGEVSRDQVLAHEYFHLKSGSGQEFPPLKVLLPFLCCEKGGE